MNFNPAPKNPTWKDVPPWTALYRKRLVHPWEKWFAWYPVKVHGKRTWLKTVYRRNIISYVDTEKWSTYEYGTIFDVLTD